MKSHWKSIIAIAAACLRLETNAQDLRYTSIDKFGNTHSGVLNIVNNGRDLFFSSSYYEVDLPSGVRVLQNLQTLMIIRGGNGKI